VGPAFIAFASLALVLAGCSDGSGPGDGTSDAFRQVSVGPAHVCAIVDSGAGYCWGQGFNFADSDSFPVRFGGDRRFTHLVAASGPFGGYVCGLTGSATVCRGVVTVNIDVGAVVSAEAGELEHDLPLVSLAAGDTHFCGLTDGGVAWCWGDKAAGVRGSGLPGSDYSFVPNPVAGDLHFSRLAAGWASTCGLAADGVVYCWGMKPFLGAPSAVTDTSYDNCGLLPPCALGPVRVELAEPARLLAGGASNTCALTDAGELWCWGYLFDGGDPVETPRHIALPVPVASVALGDGHACALATDGQAWCFGNNSVGQLGIEASGGVQTTPVPAAGSLRFTALAAGGSTTCGVTGGGALYCWGYGGEGQLGVGSRESSSVPLRVRLVANAP
jgi:hypothetical protein